MQLTLRLFACAARSAASPNGGIRERRSRTERSVDRIWRICRLSDVV